MKIAAIMTAAHLMFFSVFAVAIPYPILPYVPPNDAQLWDMVFNMFGVTAPDIEESEERAAAYWKLYRDALGAGYDAFEEDVREAFDTAKTGGALVIGAGTGIALGALQTGMESAINDGIVYGGDIVNPTDMQKAEKLKASVLEKWNVNMSIESAMQVILAWYQSGFPYAVFSKGSNNWSVVFPWQYYKQNGNIYIVAHFGYQKQTVTDINSFSRYGNNALYNDNDIVWASEANSLDLGSYQDYAVTARLATVAAQSAAVAAAIGARTLVPVTANTQLQNGAIDDTKPVVVNLPLADLPVGATGVSGLGEVQEKIGVIPSAETQDLTQAIEDLREMAQTQYGDASEYQLNLTELFPFCIPFDIGRVLTMFIAEPQAPVVNFMLPIGYGDDLDTEEVENVILFGQFTLDLSPFDGVALWVRRGEVLAFIVGLGVITREKFLRG